MNKRELLKCLPKIDKILFHPKIVKLDVSTSIYLKKKMVRFYIEELRSKILKGAFLDEKELDIERVVDGVIKFISKKEQNSLRRVINLTGVVIHTNLGRSVLAEQALKRLQELSGCYSNLEYNLKDGRRGSRYSHVSELLIELTGAEDAMVVNNNSAAVFLCFNSLAKNKEVLISRGQLVEIGGSFRIPDVIVNSGAKLKEVGCTNRVYGRDYEQAINSETAVLLTVHTSNYAVVGFSREVSSREMKKIASRNDLILMNDLGSGTFVDFSSFGFIEPTVQNVLKEKFDLVTFSADKLMGGPQAGIILGEKKLIKKLRENPLSRVLRVDKLTLGALEATLMLYRNPMKVLKTIPTLSMMTKDYKSLFKIVVSMAERLNALKISGLSVKTRRGVSRVGGGAMPLVELPTRLLEISSKNLSARELEEKLRFNDPPILCRISRDSLLIDMRTAIGDDGEFIYDFFKYFFNDLVV